MKVALMGKPDIRKMFDKDDFKGIVKALTYKKDPAVRAEAGEALAAMLEPKTYSAEISMVGLAAGDRRMSDIAVRAGAVEVLKLITRLNDEGLYRALPQVIGDPEGFVRRQAARVASNLGNSRRASSEVIGFSWMKSRLAEQMPELPKLVEKLKEQGPEVDVLIAALGDRDEEVRALAVEGVRSLHAKKALDRLSSMAQNDASLAVREQAQAAITNIHAN